MSDIHKEDRPRRLSTQRAVDDDGLVVALHGEIDHDVTDLLSVSLLSEDGTTTRIVAAPQRRQLHGLQRRQRLNPYPGRSGTPW
ncbi:hypothetical protein [Streptomyces anandii]|uniref:hypothetical protein n=1 Tax=Streptomyces anandii TaxID=285454 RepID=UPI0036C8E649